MPRSDQSLSSIPNPRVVSNCSSLTRVSLEGGIRLLDEFKDQSGHYHQSLAPTYAGIERWSTIAPDQLAGIDRIKVA